jgi:hypothetical protein
MPKGGVPLALPENYVFQRCPLPKSLASGCIFTTPKTLIPTTQPLKFSNNLRLLSLQALHILSPGTGDIQKNWVGIEFCQLGVVTPTKKFKSVVENPGVVSGVFLFFSAKNYAGNHIPHSNRVKI